MCDRRNTIVYSFDQRSPKINAFQIHEWLYEKAQLREDDIRVIQIDGPFRKVYVKFVNNESMVRIIQNGQSDLEFLHENGEISKVTMEVAGIGTRRVRITTLPPEITDTQIKNALAIYGEIQTIQEEVWSNTYRFKVKTGVRLIDMGIRKHIPSHIKIEGHRALISYEGQPMTCFRCNEQGHQANTCPRRTITGSQHNKRDGNTWAEKVRQGSETAMHITHNDNTEMESPKNIEERQMKKQQPRHSEQQENVAQDPMEMEESKIPPTEETPVNPKAKHTENKITQLTQDKGNYTPPNTQESRTNLPKWSDLLTNDSEDELDRDLDKQGKKKREKSTSPKEDEKRTDEDDTDNSIVATSKLTKTQSPKHPKKLKVERATSTSREKTRNGSRLKKPYPK
jgi:hypothetical protein